MSRPVVASLLVVAGGVAVIPFRTLAGSEGSPDGLYESVAFAAPFLGAGVAALIGLTRRNAVLVGACGVALVPMSVVSVVLIPLLVPAALLIIDGGTMVTPAGTAPTRRASVTAAGVAAGLVAAFFWLLLHQDPATWTTSTGTASSSNIITTTEATRTLVVVGALVMVAAMSSRDPGFHNTEAS